MYVLDSSEARRLLADMIAIDSVNPSLCPGGAGEQRIAEYIRDYLAAEGIESRLDQVAPGRPNVVGVLPAAEASVPETPGASGTASTSPGTPDISPAGTPTGSLGVSPLDMKHGLILNGHTDIVSTSGMSIEPLKAVFDGDRVYGRGTNDMKGGLVSLLLAMVAVKRSGKKLRRSVLFTGVCDEEYASIGTEDVACRYRADAALIAEPTGMNLTVAHKGFAWVTVDVLGKAAHGSRFEEGNDAIGQMGKVLVGVNDLARKYLKMDRHPIVGPRSIHWSLISGGTELSTYPDSCKAQLERRTIPGEDPAAIGDEIQEILGRLRKEDPTFNASVSVDFTRNAYEISKDAEIVKTLVASCKTVLGREPELGGGSGWMDSALLGDAGIPTVVFGPQGVGSHSAVEYVTMSSILNAAAVMADTIEKFCGQ